MRYLDIDTILAEEERVPCFFQSDARKLAFLDSSLPTEDLPKGSRIEIPLWMAGALSDRGMVRIEMPKHYGARIRDELNAAADQVNLKDFSYYFFEVGLRLCQITKDLDLQRTLRIAFCGNRYNSSLVRCLSSGHTDNIEFSQSLTSNEYKIYKLGIATAMQLHEWKTRQSHVMQKSSLLRRRSMTDDDERDRKRQSI